MLSHCMLPRIQLTTATEMSEATKVMFGSPKEGLNNRLDILVCGKTGVGKSTLINALLGSEICDVGDAAEEFDDEDAFKAKTLSVDETSTSVNGVTLRIFDSPGLQDGTDSDERYVNLMHEKCKDADLVFYCLEMHTARWTPREVEAASLLTKKFGVEFWKKAVLILTKANMVQPRKRKSAEEQKQYFKTTLEKLANKFRKELRKSVPPEIADNVPAVAVGCEAVQVLQDGESFVRSLWLTCFQRVTGDAKEKFVLGTDAIYRVIPPEAYSSTAGKQLDFDEMIAKGWGAKIPELDKIKSKLEDLHREEEKVKQEAREHKAQLQREEEKVKQEAEKVKQETEKVKQEAREREAQLQRQEEEFKVRQREEELRQQAVLEERYRALERRINEMKQDDPPPAYPIPLTQEDRQSVGDAMAEGAITWATVGGFFSPVGAAVGAAVGAVSGFIKSIF